MSSSLHAMRHASLAPGYFEQASVELFNTLRVQASWPDRPVGPTPSRPMPAHLLASEWRDPPAYRCSGVFRVHFSMTGDCWGFSSGKQGLLQSFDQLHRV